MRAKTANSTEPPPGLEPRPAPWPAASGPRPEARPRRPTVAMVVYDGLSLFEFGVATEIFGIDRSKELGVAWYRLSVCGARPTVVTDTGLELQVPHGLGALRRAGTVVVPPSLLAQPVPAEIVQGLQMAHRRGARILSLCTGAFVLAAAGLLDGRRATTHWTECDQLARSYPQVGVDPGVLYVDGGDILTSAGSAAGIDLCLHIVRQDYGADIAARLARELVVPPYRQGGQAQYIETPLPDLDSSALFADTLAWAQAHLDLPVTVDDLAKRAVMSRRTFARQFSAATGTTPYQWLLRQRLQMAQRLLETSELSVDLVAEKSGFSTAANLRRHFGRLVRTSPQAYRLTFKARSTGSSSPGRA